MARTRRSKWSTNLACLPLEDRCNPGGGTFLYHEGTNTQVFNFSVAIRFNASEDEMNHIKESFQDASDVILDATDGQQRFGTVTLINNSMYSAEAEFQIMKDNEKTPNADRGRYGVRGCNVRLFMRNDGHLYGWESGDRLGAGYSIAHEFGHLAYNLGDEYQTKTGAFARNSEVESRSLNFSLMDNYFSRGGRILPNPNPDSLPRVYTLNEFSTKRTHETDYDTWHSTENNNRSDWETIRLTKYAPPVILTKFPDDTPPASLAVNFVTNATNAPSTMILLENTSSMDETKQQFMNLGARLYLQTTKSTERTGVMRFNSDVNVVSQLRLMTSENRQAAIDAVVGMTSSNEPVAEPIVALNVAKTFLTGSPIQSVNKVIVLVGSGTDTAELDMLDLVPTLNAADIAVISVLVSESPSQASINAYRELASRTGGRFFQLRGNTLEDIAKLSIEFNQERQGNGILSNAPPYSIPPNGSQQSVVTVASGSPEVVLGTAGLTPGANFTVSLISPSGQTISAPGPGVEDLGTNGPLQGFRVSNPEAGPWTIVTSAGATDTGPLNTIGLLPDDPYRVTVTMADPNAAFPAPARLTATVTYQGIPVIGAALTGTVTRPDGTQSPAFFFDDGQDAHGDSEADDGEYSMLFNDFSPGGNGVYDVTVFANGVSTVQSNGEIGLTDDPNPTPPTPTAVPDFFRTGTSSFSVTGVPAVVESNDLGVFLTPFGAQTFVVTVSNQGATPATNVNARVHLGSAIHVRSMQPGQGTASVTDDVLTFSPGTIPAGQSVTLNVTVQSPRNQNYNLIADVASSSQIDPLLFNNRVHVPLALAHTETISMGTDRGIPGQLQVFETTSPNPALLQPFGGFTGGVRTAAGDFNGDGIADLVVGTGPGRATNVQVLDGVSQQVLFTVDPFEAAFTGGVFVAAGDMNGDGKAELLISPDEGGGPRVQVYNGADFVKKADFFGIGDPDFRGGARANVGDLNGDGLGDLVVSAGFGGGPRIAAFNGALLQFNGGPKLFGDFFAFEPELRNGAYVAAGDLNGDGFAELIAGAGPGGGPRVLALDGEALTQNNGQLTATANFFGGNVDGRGGIRVAVKDLDGDNKADLVVGAGTGAGSRVTAYLGKNITANGTPPAELDFDAFAGFTGGVFVG